MNTPAVHIEIVCAWPDRVWLRRLTLPRGSTVGDALAAADIGRELPELADPPQAGIYGRIVLPVHVLCDGDRIELYRPLLADPKDARRQRASGRV